MYRSNNIIFVMFIGLMPACSSKEQMAITLPGSNGQDRPPLLNTMTTINTLIIYRQKKDTAEVVSPGIVHKVADESAYLFHFLKKQLLFSAGDKWTEIKL